MATQLAAAVWRCPVLCGAVRLPGARAANVGQLGRFPRSGAPTGCGVAGLGQPHPPPASPNHYTTAIGLANVTEIRSQ